MSELRKEILETMEEHLQERGMLKKFELLDSEKPFAVLQMADEEQLLLLIHMEKTWNIVFGENAAIEFSRNMDAGTPSDLISIIIRIMNNGF